MRIAFLGTPDFAVQSLAELVAAGHEVACVYSQPPAPRGRGQELKPSPVHAFAEGLGLSVRTPASMKDPAEIEAFRALDLDAAVVVAFGQILTKAVLEAPRLGCFNLHASLLPRWRGHYGFSFFPFSYPPIFPLLLPFLSFLFPLPPSFSP